MVGWFVGGLTVALAMPPVEVAVQSQGSAPEVRSSSPSAPSSRRSHDDVAEASDSSGTVDENYIRESVLQPNAKVVAGFTPQMPTFAGQINDEQMNALIAYIKSLK